MPVLREALLKISRSKVMKSTVTHAPVTRRVVDRYVAGETTDDALRATRALADAGLTVTIDHLGEDTTKREQAGATTDAYLDLLARLSEAGLAATAEVSVKLSAIGQLLGAHGEKIATENAQLICEAALEVGTTVTVDMEDHTTTDSTLGIVAELRRDYPWVGAVLQAYLFRTEADCEALAGAGSRVRLCKGAYAEPESVAHTDPAEIDRAYVRCLKILMSGDGYPMVATHDPRLVEIAVALAEREHRAKDSFELQMLYGIRPSEQARLAWLGHRVRVYVPYGTDWYGYLVRRLAEKPSNMRFFAHSLISRK
ncbi:proline dehydrogenase family protein [Microlunatus aurantiacus]|uniref:proline dehydrogenase n=1 Tax=Microlunatus aurantiacus TaxID=446786 RepID=A0ABP7EFS0_9ACTN